MEAGFSQTQSQIYMQLHRVYGTLTKFWPYKYFTIYPEFFVACTLYVSRLHMEPWFSQLKFCGWRLSKRFHVFHTFLHSYVRRIYTIHLSEIDKAPYQKYITVEAILDLPVASLGNQYCRRWASQSGPMTLPCLIKK